MKDSGLVSIIIPTYNRAHLLGETLDSVLAQTYPNWECIVVDDGSTDNTKNLVQAYAAEDHRIHYYKRPKHKLKGAPGCRNFGFIVSKGDFINFFDSDDLMHVDFLSHKLNVFDLESYDFVIARTAGFTVDRSQLTDRYEGYYRFQNYQITQENYVMQNINWLTPDGLYKRQLFSKDPFNEYLQSGQEYNFITGVLVKTNRGFFIDEVLTFRRIHENSIKGSLKPRTTLYFTNKYRLFSQTLSDFYPKLNVQSKKYLIYQSMHFSYELAAMKRYPTELLRFIKNSSNTIGPKKMGYFILGLFLVFFFNKGFKLFKMAQPKL
ncbi:glycosyltransferase family 2 protein [Leeuwenhoekiella nanhaiensis]|uniref:glycosyltransferase family 2 protein n=1 Tax=Leeuwenhoekiella nanhaiensis TaxID=1655491 RepID=UPI001670C621|nr:glycosyltransferase family 2 protein [Leeuwenhoekiella nanhaiensis]